MKGPISRSAPDLFRPIRKPADQHPAFGHIAAGENHLAARRAMSAAFERGCTWDQHFVREFQGQNFDARVWELFLYRTFMAEGLNVRVNGGQGPDFALHHRGQEIYVEAVTVNPYGGPTVSALPDWKAGLFPTDLPTVRQAVGEDNPIRFSSSLRKKGDKNYWARLEYANAPFVLAVQDFQAPNSLGFANAGLLSYLYGAQIPDEPGAPMLARSKAEHLSGTRRQAPGSSTRTARSA